MIQLVKEFEEFAYKIDVLIAKSNYKTKYFIESLSLSKPTFYRKMREKTFTVQELGKIAELLYPQEYYQWKIDTNRKVSKQQFEDGDYYHAKKTVLDLKARLQDQ